MQNQVAEYYDSNTLKFLSNKDLLRTGAIHRRLYAQRGDNSLKAAHHSNALVLQSIQQCKARRILDLGCGIGGSIRYLNARHNAKYIGLTISPKQAQIAASLGTEISAADYLDQSWFEHQQPMDAIYAIESVQHNPDHAKLAANLQSISHENTRLIIIDDFLSPGVDEQHPLVRDFHRHWKVPGVTNVENFVSQFAAHGFQLVGNEDLTGLMAPRALLRFFGGAAATFLRVFGLSGSYIDNIIGGNALLQLQHRGMAQYRMLEFSRKVSDPAVQM